MIDFLLSDKVGEFINGEYGLGVFSFCKDLLVINGYWEKERLFFLFVIIDKIFVVIYNFFKYGYLFDF